MLCETGVGEKKHRGNSSPHLNPLLASEKYTSEVISSNPTVSIHKDTHSSIGEEITTSVQNKIVLKTRFNEYSSRVCSICRAW